MESDLQYTGAANEVGEQGEGGGGGINSSGSTLSLL